MLNYDYCQISDWLEGKLVSRSWLPNIGPEDILISLWSRVHICTSDYLQTLSCPSVTPVFVAGVFILRNISPLKLHFHA